MTTTSTLIRFSEVEKLTGMSRQKICQLEKDGTFPKRIKVPGSRSTTWVKAEVLAFLDSFRHKPAPVRATSNVTDHLRAEMSSYVHQVPLRRFLRKRDVLNITATRTTKLYGLVRDGLFPPQIKRGRSSFWVADEGAAVNSAIIAGGSDEQIKTLVTMLGESRRQGGDV